MQHFLQGHLPEDGHNWGSKHVADFAFCNFIYKLVPMYLHVICTETYRGYVKPRIIPNEISVLLDNRVTYICTPLEPELFFKF
jgi:hypothetical protein